MSFYHILASNAAPQTFPTNHASSFSTPIDNPYDLNGRWEVSLTNMTHSNCVYTFNNEKYEIFDPKLKTKSLPDLTQHYKIGIPFPSNIVSRKEKINHVINFVSKHKLLKNILRVRRIGNNDDFVMWKVLAHDLFIIISQSLQVDFRLYSSVLTADDLWPLNYKAIRENKTSAISDAYIIVGNRAKFDDKIVIKEKDVEMSLTNLITAFNEKVPSNIASLEIRKNRIHLKNAIIILF